MFSPWQLTFVLWAIVSPTAQNSSIMFRCDSIRFQQTRANCQGNVVLHHAGLWLCCDSMWAQADKSWQWKSLQCTGRVRAKWQEQHLWSKNAQYNIEDQKITFNTHVLLAQHHNIMQGASAWLLLRANESRVHISQAQGTIINMKKMTAYNTPSMITSPLPSSCPLANQPNTPTQ